LGWFILYGCIGSGLPFFLLLLLLLLLSGLGGELVWWGVGVGGGRWKGEVTVVVVFGLFAKFLDPKSRSMFVFIIS
jgi:hypothetical protein